MPLSAGTAAKYGPRYEDRWTAHCAFNVLRERAQWIQIEPPTDAAGFEFRIKYQDRIEYHQVKRQKTGEDDWSIAVLKRERVLDAFWTKLQDPSVHCVFVSTYSVGVLDELIDRSKKGEWEDVKRDFFASKTWKEAFAELSVAWGNPGDRHVISALKRMRVEPIGETYLNSYNAVLAETTFEGEELSGAVPKLIEVLRDNVNVKLSAFDLWRALEPGYRPGPWSGSPQLAKEVADQNRLYRSTRAGALITGRLLHREETEQLLAAINNHRVVTVTGVAGVGKSGVLLEFTDQLRDRGVPYLAFRLDSVTPSPRPESVGANLGLSRSPAAALSIIAQDRPAVLVIDQLDAVSAASGRSVEFFNCLHAILELALRCENVRVVLACRGFDLENDSRLRELTKLASSNTRVEVGYFPEDRIRSVVSELGYKADKLTPAQERLFAVPLHLALLAEVARSTDERRLTFQTANDLYVEFWTLKRKEVERTAGVSSEMWMRVMYRLVDYMSENRVLRAPRLQVDDWATAANAMASSHVLIMEGTHYAFFHEMFFDYVFARCFLARGETVSTLLAQDQFLFRRSQVRQVLTLARAEGLPQYASDLRYLLTDPSVRFHIQESVIGWLCQLTPTSEEWALIEPLLADRTSRLSQRAWTTMQMPSWFRVADERGAVQRWLRSDGNDADSCAWGLAAVCDAEPDRVAELLRPYVAASAKWSERIGYVLFRADLSRSRALFELCVEMLDRGALDPIEERKLGVWDIARELQKERPAWACELLGHFLRNRLDAAARTSIANPFRAPNIIPSSLHLHELITEAAKQCPEAFVDHVWPHICAIVERTVRQEIPGRPLLDEVWLFRHLSEDETYFDDFDDQLLVGSEVALRELARRSPASFERLVKAHYETPFETIDYLLFQGFAAFPSALGNLAVDFVLHDERRFQVGISDDSHWGTHELLKAITPHLSDGAIGSLCARIISYYPPEERTEHGIERNGNAQFSLLDGIDRSRLPARAEQRLFELQRKFNRHRPRGPWGLRGGTVESPIAPERAEKMTDAQWRKAVACYNSDDRRHRRAFLKGGASELARVLETATSSDPDRFARFALALPDDTHAVYFEGVLRGVASSKQSISVQLTGELLERCHRLPGRPCGRWIGGPLRRHAEDEVPPRLLEIIAWYAQHDPDPDAGESRWSTEDEAHNMFSGGLNSVRGGAANDIAKLIDGNAKHVSALLPAVEALACDPVPAVRAMAAEALGALVRHDSEKALALFLELVHEVDDRILVTHGVNLYLSLRAGVDFARLRPVLERMLVSARTKVRKDGAVHVTRVSLAHDVADDLLVVCRHGDAEHRSAVARVYATNLLEFRSRCEEQLAHFFDDEDPKVREAAGTAIWRFTGDQLGQFRGLAERFVHSSAFNENADDMLHALESTTSCVPDLALSVCERVIDGFGTDAASVLTGAARQALEVAKILMRAYAESRDRAEKDRALDLIDRALQCNVFGTDKAVADIDRVWK